MVTILTKKIKFVMKFSNHPSNQMFNFYSKMYVTMYVIMRVIFKICCILKKLLAPLFSFHNLKKRFDNTALVMSPLLFFREAKKVLFS